jgi:hypothetical protein
MKSIFTFIFALFVAVSSSFSQTESLLASVEIISAPEVEMEKDTTFAFVSECDSLDSMDDKYSWLTMPEVQFNSLETSEISCPLSIKKITYTRKFDFSVSDIERTPDSVKEFVGSVNDSTIFISETDGKFFSVNSFDDQYESIIVADTIVVDDRFFVFDSTQMAIIKKFIHDNYIVGSTDTVARMISFVSGYTEDEELAIFARWEKDEVVENVIIVDEKSADVGIQDVFAEITEAETLESEFIFGSNRSSRVANCSFGGDSEIKIHAKIAGVGFTTFSEHWVKNGIIAIIVVVSVAIIYFFRRRRKPYQISLSKEVTKVPSS